MKSKIKLSVFFLALSVLISGIGAQASSNTIMVNPSYYNVLYFGAKPNDGVDDLAAFNKAKSGTMYIPQGEYTISDTISLNNVNLVGDGSDKTIIVADIKDATKPIMTVGRTVTVRGVTIKYKDGLITGKESDRERVGLYTYGTSYSLQRGSSLYDLKIQNVGTGFASGLNMYTDGGQLMFSVTIDKLVVKDFSYRGIDIRSNDRTGNYYKNVTVSSGKYYANSAIYFTGEESESAIDQITVKDTIADMPVYINRMHSISAKRIVLDNVYSLYNPLIIWESSHGNIDNLTFDYCDTHIQGSSLIKIGSSTYISSTIPTLNSLHIGTLKLNSFNYANVKNIVTRSSASVDDFYFTVDNYVIKNSDLEWEDFPADENNIIITQKGQIATEGATDERPEKCLCPYYSTYYDTTLKKTVIWDGKEWK